MTKVKAHYHGHRTRLKERLMRAPDSLADYEVLELVLGLAQLRRDTKPLAKELLEKFGSIQGVLNAHPESLRTLSGFSDGTMALWQLLRELMARFHESEVTSRKKATPEDIAKMAQVRLAGCPHEEIWLALLDSGSRLIAWLKMDKGTVNASSVYAREILEEAVRCKATGIILVHNHPGGVLEPSAPDITFTRQLNHVATVVGLTLIDHLVVTDTAWYSFRTEKLLK